MRKYKKKLHSSWPPYNTDNPGNIVDVGGINPLKQGGFVKWQIMKDGGPVDQEPIQPLVVNDPNNPRLKAYKDSLDLYNLSQNQWIYPNAKPTTKEDYEKKYKIDRSSPVYSFDEDQFKKDKKRGKVKDFNEYVFRIERENYIPTALEKDAFQRNVGKDFETLETPVIEKLKNGRERIFTEKYKGKLDRSHYTEIDPITHTERFYTDFGNSRSLLDINNKYIKPIKHNYYALDKLQNTGGIYISKEISESVNGSKTFEERSKISYPEFSYGATRTDEYKKPVQPVVYQPKQEIKDSQSKGIKADKLRQQAIKASFGNNTYTDSLKAYNTSMAALKAAKINPNSKYAIAMVGDHPVDNDPALSTVQNSFGKIKPIGYTNQDYFIPIYKKPVGTGNQEMLSPIKQAAMRGGQDFPPVDQIMGPAGQQLYRKDYHPKVWNKMAPPRKPVTFGDGGPINKWEIMEDGGNISSVRDNTTVRLNSPNIQFPDRDKLSLESQSQDLNNWNLAQRKFFPDVFEGLEEPLQYKNPYDGGPRIRINDPRKINPITRKVMNPKKDYKSGNYSQLAVDDITTTAIEQGIKNPKEIKKYLAISLQESGLGTTDEELGHTLYANPDHTQAAKLIESYQKNKTIGRKNHPDLKGNLWDFQYYNTPYPEKGFINKNTEKSYHANSERTSNTLYGLPMTNKKISLLENPLYGKTVNSLYDSVINMSPEIDKRINYWLNNKKQHGGPITQPNLGLQQAAQKYWQQGGYNPNTKPNWATGQADYVPIESLLLPATPYIKGIGKIGNMIVDAANPLSGMRSTSIKGNHFKIPSLNSITQRVNGVPFDESIINDFTKKEVDWLNSEEYISRKMKATGKTRDIITKEREQIFDKVRKTNLNILDEKADEALGAYSPDGKNPTINIFNAQNSGLELNTIDHEIKHAVSEAAIRPMDGLVDMFTGPYKKYPKLKVSKWQDYLLPGQTTRQWANEPAEQQVISKRIMDMVERNQGIKRGTALKDSNIKLMIDDLNSEIKSKNLENHDISTMLHSIKSKYGKGYHPLVTKMVNDAYTTIPYAIPTIIGASTLHQDKKNNPEWYPSKNKQGGLVKSQWQIIED